MPACWGREWLCRRGGGCQDAHPFHRKNLLNYSDKKSWTVPTSDILLPVPLPPLQKGKIASSQDIT